MPRLLLAALLVLTGCGVKQPDLMVLDRSGIGPGARLNLLVSDGGTVSCNGGPPRALPSDYLIQARGAIRDLETDLLADRSREPGPRSILRYRVRAEDGTVSWADTSRPLPQPYFELAAFAHRTSEDICKLDR